MTIGFSKEWMHHSWSTDTSVKLDQRSEQLLIEEMILHSDSDLVRTFAQNSAELGVYVRTGIHRSVTEARDHVQVVLGSNEPQSWRKTGAVSGYTAHILFHDSRGNPTKRYETHVFEGQPHLNRVGS